MATESQVTYPTPPIAEAVIELRFESSLTADQQAKLIDKLKSKYPEDTTQRNLSVHIDADTFSATVTQSSPTHKLSSADGSELFLVGPNFVAIAQLPIYQGWTYFSERMRSDWNVAKKLLGFRKIARIGLRYVNKLDFPFEDDLVQPDKYLKIYIEDPPEFGNKIQSSLSAVYEVPELEAVMLVQSATIESLLPKHLGMLLDIDVGRNVNVPQNDEAVFDYLEQARHFKNRMFEACITDVTRKTFYSELRIGS
jgi:uncharacterized protein (TIGR04255 family)